MFNKMKSEADFCDEVSKLIAGIFIGTKKENVVFVPEVPIDYFSNNQIDMLLLDVKNLEYLCLEFKLKNYKALIKQISNAQGKGIPVIGIINNKPKKVCSYESILDYLPEERKIFSYTGKDDELELLGDNEKGLLCPHFWQSIYYSKGMIYYWAYKNEKNNFRGGITTGNRDGFAKIYMQAIKNLLAYYGKLDFMLIHSCLNSGYSLATSKKYYQRCVNS